MGQINEIKEKMGVVKSVGGFANALQQIAAMRMTSLRDKVLASKRFVDEATVILRELNLYKELYYREELDKKKKNEPVEKKKDKEAVIIVTSNQGLCGKFNAEIFKQVEGHILKDHENAEIYLIGKKGQEHYLTNKKYHYRFFPYSLPDEFTSKDLMRLVQMFPYYSRVLMVYSRFINTIKRDVVESFLVTPPSIDPNIKVPEEELKFLFEPTIDDLIKNVSAKLRAATFNRQIMDSRLAQFSAQMVGMQAASENAKVLTGELTHEYNKQRRKMIDKKIAEVLGGSALW
jgi:F-type H+-transporting ATPase subunit gamma